LSRNYTLINYFLLIKVHIKII
jgi:hypothetical protein